jgi:hypothetical protein
VAERCLEDGVPAHRSLSWSQILNRALRQVDVEERTFSSRVLGTSTSFDNDEAGGSGSRRRRASQDEEAKDGPPKKMTKRPGNDE